MLKYVEYRKNLKDIADTYRQSLFGLLLLLSQYRNSIQNKRNPEYLADMIISGLIVNNRKNPQIRTMVLFINYKK